MLMSLADWLSVNVPVSPKIVGHGLVVEHTPPLVTIVRTSDTSVGVGVPVFAEPRVAVSELTTRMELARLLRTTSPHEVADTATAAAIQNRENVRIVFIASCRYPLMMRGVMKIRSSLLLSMALSRLNSHFRSGIVPSPGVRSV